MKTAESRSIKCFNVNNTDETWGIVVTTVERQPIPPHSSYPRSQHPKSHIFEPRKGRVLKEYQSVCISKGKGWLESESYRRQEIRAGTMPLLFPNEWRTYEPDQKTGWFEYWMGLRGEHIDRRVGEGFSTSQHPVFHIGFNSPIIGLYKDIVNYTLQERSACQQIISSIVFYTLGMVYYKHKNETFNDSSVISKISEACAIMKREGGYTISPRSITQNLGANYSWFRKMFKLYVDVSPAQYQVNMKLLRARELLNNTDLSITDITYKLGFENASQFSTFFRRKTGVPSLQCRKEEQRVERLE